MKSQVFPEFDRISQLTAAIILVFVLAKFINLPSRLIEISLSYFYIAFEINVNTIISILAAGMAASGADWVIRSNSNINNHTTIQHWVLPSLTTLIIGITLNRLSYGVLWWFSIVFGATILIIILIGEYTVVTPVNPHFPSAIAGLTALSFALFLILAINLKFTSTRLLFLIPSLCIPIGVICLRTILLRLQLNKSLSNDNRRIAFFASITVSVVIGEIITGLHYWDLTPVVFGLILLGPSYAITNFLGNLADGKLILQASFEPIIILALFWGFAYWVQI